MLASLSQELLILCFFDQVSWSTIQFYFKEPCFISILVDFRWIFNNLLIKSQKFAFCWTVNLCSGFDTFDSNNSSSSLEIFTNCWVFNMNYFAQLALSMISDTDSIFSTLQSLNPFVTLCIFNSQVNIFSYFQRTAILILCLSLSPTNRYYNNKNLFINV